MDTILAVLCLGALASLLLALARQHRRYRRLRPGAAAPLDAPFMSVIVPARNEAANIGRCLQGLLRQDYPLDRYEVIVVDDNSADGTGDIVRQVQAGAPHLHLIQAGPLPRGWTGKPHACYQGALQARGELFGLVDADTVAAPALLRVTAACAQQERLDMLTLHPFHELGSFWKRAVLPAQFLLFALSTDVRCIHDPAAADAVANGQFILLRREAYRALGGHRAVQREILEGFALARLVKGAGRRLLVARGEELIST